jgi:LPS O-antigen subunit length determinant protein (WzzB/FepE family)
LKIDAGNLLKLLPKRNTSLYVFLPLFEQAINLYQRTLENAQRLSQTSTSTTHVDISTVDNLHYDITLELRELLEQISTTEVNQQSLREIQVINAFMKDLLKERRLTRRMVTGLHGSLTNVIVQVGRSIEIAESQHIEKSKTYTSLQKNIIDFENRVKKETDITLLK